MAFPRRFGVAIASATPGEERLGLLERCRKDNVIASENIGANNSPKLACIAAFPVSGITKEKRGEERNLHDMHASKVATNCTGKRWRLTELELLQHAWECLLGLIVI